ncbi:hypothetical protein DENSPDRAFT_174809 [Dentipellis sp. KUC8613]|nr:hypothetical protein DENSPDRAFT_174809 [Dentipellis sp. KUC8613]
MRIASCSSTSTSPAGSGHHRRVATVTVTGIVLPTLSHPYACGSSNTHIHIVYLRRTILHPHLHLRLALISPQTPHSPDLPNTININVDMCVCKNGVGEPNRTAPLARRRQLGNEDARSEV